MASVPELLLNTLWELVDEDLNYFKWYLYNGVSEEFTPIPKARIRDADRGETVDALVQKYGQDGAVEVTLDILRRMGFNELSEKLKEKYNKGIGDLKYLKEIK